MAPGAELYLIRHAIAAERGEEYLDDAKRPLTQQGINRLKKEVAGLVELDVSFDLILTSPLVRARQTAEVVAAGLPSKPPVTNIDSLAPGASHAAVMDDLAKHARRSRIALVGHEPGMGELAARLIGARRAIEFKKGAICRIDVDALPPTGAGHLRWLVTPKMLRKIGRGA